MAKNPACNSIAVRDNLLARLLNIFYIIPPVVKKTPGAIHRSLIKYSLPVPSTRRFSGRARDLRENKDPGSELSTVASPAAEAFASGRSRNSARAFIERALIEETGNRSFLAGSPAACRSNDCIACAGCGCKCDHCRKKAQEWLLPRVAGDRPPFAQPEKPYGKRLHLIRAPGDCILGALACGYVLKGSGSVKSRSRKRA